MTTELARPLGTSTAQRRAGQPRTVGAAATAAVLRSPLVPAVLAGVLGLMRIGQRSLWYDEAISVRYVRASTSVFVKAVAGDTGNMAPYYLVLRPWVALVGQREALLRIPSVAFAVIAVVLLWLLARRLFDATTATLAALLLAVDPTSVRFSQEARSYSMTVALVLGATLALWSAVYTGRRGAWALYVVVATTAAYSHFFALFVVAGHAAWVLSGPRGRQRRQFLGALTSIAVLLLPIVGLTLRHGTGQVAWVAPTNAQSLGESLQLVVGGSTVYGWVRIALAATCVLLVLSALAALRPHAQLGARSRSGIRLGAWWVTAAVLLPLAVSAVKPLVVPRYFVVAVPGVCLLAAVGARQLRPRWVAVVPVVLLLATSAMALTSWYRLDYGTEASGWRSASNLVLRNGRATDGAIFLPQFSRQTFDYYWVQAGRPARSPQPIAPGEAYGDEQRQTLAEVPVATLLPRLGQHRRVWLVASIAPLTLAPGDVAASRPSGASGESQVAAVRRALRRDGLRLVSTTRFRDVAVELFAH